MAVAYIIPRRGYPYYPYTLFRDSKFFAVNGTADKQNEVISGIARIIAENKKELIDKLDKLDLACPCALENASEKDLSEVVIENIGNKDFQKWLSEKIASYRVGISANAEGDGGGDGGGGNAGAWLGAVTEVFKTIGIISKGGQQNKAQKAEYKNLIASEAVKYKQAQEKAKRTEQAYNNLMYVGGALIMLGIGAVIYFNVTKDASIKNVQVVQ